MSDYRTKIIIFLLRVFTPLREIQQRITIAGRPMIERKSSPTTNEILSGLSASVHFSNPLILNGGFRYFV